MLSEAKMRVIAKESIEVPGSVPLWLNHIPLVQFKQFVINLFYSCEKCDDDAQHESINQSHQIQDIFDVFWRRNFIEEQIVKHINDGNRPEERVLTVAAFLLDGVPC